MVKISRKKFIEEARKLKRKKFLTGSEARNRLAKEYGFRDFATMEERMRSEKEWH